MDFDFDVIVIGSGAGGGTFAYACARAGKRVLVVERGQRVHPSGLPHDEVAMLVDKEPFDDRPVTIDGAPRRLYMGGVLGGGTSLYGAALVRPSPDDLHPGRHYGDRLPRPIWDWPVPYEALAPYYDEAEALYEVAGDDDEDFGPLGRPRAFPRPAVPPAPINQRLIAGNRARGLAPFRLPLAIDFDTCRRCDACPGFVCPNGARRSSVHLVDRAVGAGWPLELSTGVEVERLSVDGRGRVDGVRVVDLQTGRRSILRARRYALAAGAIGSAVVLLRSDLGGPLVGRHYMMHLSPVVAGVYLRPTGAERTFVKQVGFADHYFGTPSFPHKLGMVQSLPVPGPRMLAKNAPLPLPRPAVGVLRRRMLPLTGLVEDLPDPANRVTLGPEGQPVLTHRFSAYDRARGRYLAGRMRRILANAGALFSVTTYASVEHVAHQCGTLRSGRDPAHAVVDPDGRLFGQPDVFVVDGSTFPTSLGVNPALTIAANALRAAEIVTREL